MPTSGDIQTVKTLNREFIRKKNTRQVPYRYLLTNDSDFQYLIVFIQLNGPMYVRAFA